VSKADLVGYYLPAFKACIMEGKALGIMCSYNAVCPLLCLHPGATDMAVAVAMYR
jgi:beta-glucosidase-like glycosyl hydrolase